jgi:DNA-binding beta-propeller fold protein YncE
MTRHFAFVVAALFLALGVAAANVAESAGHHTRAQKHGWMASDANPKHPWLYVAGFDNDVISIYDIAAFRTKLIGQITHVSTPNGIKLDAQGTLYVANYDNNIVSIYPADATSPSLILSAGLNVAVDIAVDALGNVYVFNRGTSPPNITVFPPGQTVPSATITSSLIQYPMALMFDTSGNLFIADFLTGVSEMKYGSQQPVSLGLVGAIRTMGIAPDPAKGHLFACLDRRRDRLQTIDYAPGRARSRRFLDGGNVASDFMTLGRIKGREYLFESVYNTNQVLVYEHDSKNLIETIATASEDAEGIAFKPAGVP